MAGVSGTNRLPKDAQVIVSMLKEAGINDYEPRVVNQLLEFTYRYVTGILDESRVYAQHAKKKTIDLDDCKLASMMQLERSFTSPPPRDMLMEVAKGRNSSALPVIKPHYGLRLPPDRHCLSACNYKLKSNKKNLVSNKSMHVGSSLLSSGRGMGTNMGRGSNLNVKVTPGSGGNMTMMSSMQSATQPIRTKVMAAPKPVIKFNTTTVGGSSASALPKIQIAGGSMPSSSLPTPTVSAHTSVLSTQAGIDIGALKRKREPDDSFETRE